MSFVPLDIKQTFVPVISWFGTGDFVQLDRHPGVHHNLRRSVDGHHGRDVRAVVRLQQLCDGEDVVVAQHPHHVPAAAAVRRRLLLENCLHSENQGDIEDR